MSPETMIRHFSMGVSFEDISEDPRLLLRDEEAALHSLAGGLNIVIDVYDVGANEIVTFSPSRRTPNRTRWIIRYPNGMFGAARERDAVGQEPGPAQDRDREEYRENRSDQAKRKGQGITPITPLQARSPATS